MRRDDAERLLELSRDADFLGPDTATWIERLTPQREKLAKAVRSLVEDKAEAEAAELAANIWRLWLMSGDIEGGRALLATVLDSGAAQPSRARALALYADGVLAFRQGAQDESQKRNEAALAAARAVGDLEAESLALVGLSRVAFRNGDYARVRTLALEARRLVHDLEPTARVAPLHLLAAGTRLAGELDEAVALYEESLESNRRIGDRRMVAIELHNVGHVELHRGNIQKAERCFAEYVELHNPNDPYDAAMTKLDQAALALARGEANRALELLRGSESTLQGAGIVLDPDDAFEVDRLHESLAAEGIV